MGWLFQFSILKQSNWRLAKFQSKVKFKRAWEFSNIKIVISYTKDVVLPGTNMEWRAKIIARTMVKNKDSKSPASGQFTTIISLVFSFQCSKSIFIRCWEIKLHFDLNLHSSVDHDRVNYIFFLNLIRSYLTFEHGAIFEQEFDQFPLYHLGIDGTLHELGRRAEKHNHDWELIT